MVTENKNLSPSPSVSAPADDSPASNSQGLSENEKKQIVESIKNVDKTSKMTKMINSLKDNIGAASPIIVPSNREFPAVPKTGRVAIEYSELPWKPNHLIPILSDKIQRKKKMYGAQLEEILKNTPTLDFVIYNSNLALLLSNSRNYTCMKAFDLLRYYLYVFMICVDSNDIAESNEQRNQILHTHAEFRKLVEDLFDKDYQYARLKIKTKCKKDYDGMKVKDVFSFISDVSIAAVNYCYNLIQCYEITLLNFFSTNKKHNNGIPQEQWKNLYLLRNIPPKEHALDDCLEQLRCENDEYHEIRNRSIDCNSGLVNKMSEIIDKLNIGNQLIKIETSRFKDGIYTATNEFHKNTKILINFTESSKYYHSENDTRYVPFVYWNYSDALNMIKWIEYLDQTIDGKQYMENLQQKMMVMDFPAPKLISLKDPTLCELDTIGMDIDSQSESISIKYSDSLFTSNQVN